ncbi:MAG: DUF480 domain-containing protein [Planctomycetia bacterium]|nr:DUF480 domain-containing protein [Planctomycetia bacterium]
MDDAQHEPAEKTKPKWQPISALERRILGVLVEKAKTVPESYPMTLNGITTGCNQKNNRYPVMQIESDQLDTPLEHLRDLGAIAVVQGNGRTEKFRHYLNDWFGIEKAEMAVMAELLLRGAQSEGELRQRASRMEPIADLTTLRNVLHSLKTKNLIVSLTSDGRGHVLTHNLYEPRELEKVRRDYEAQPAMALSGAISGSRSRDDDDEPTPSRSVAISQTTSNPAISSPATASASSSAEWREAVESLREELRELKAEVESLREEVSMLRG